ncbi:MAG: hypothetical protein U9O56_08230 [Campylobacterota bacterium]|nr:hypothetical protein [Campylobacterota bacterium]
MELQSIQNNNIDYNIIKPETTTKINTDDVSINNKLSEVDSYESIKINNEMPQTLIQNNNVLLNNNIDRNNITNQLELVNNIATNLNNAISSKNTETTLDNIQPKIESLMIDYNQLSSSSSSNSDIEEVKSRIFFDGVLGSKPLSSKEIFEAINKQKELLSQLDKTLEVNNENIINDSIQNINNEIQQYNEESPFQYSDFSNQVDINIANFSNDLSDVQSITSNTHTVELLS